MAALDSTAVFEQRVRDLGLAKVWPKLEARRWTSHGAFAFACSTGPAGNVAADDFRAEVLTPLFELAAGDPLPEETSFLRRLFFESNALAMQDMRSRAERTDADPPRRLPPVEREARREALAARLTGVTLDGSLEPAHYVVDRFSCMLEDCRLEFLPWTLIATRKQELKFGPGRKRWLPDASGRIREVETHEPPEADVNTHFEVNLALQRRSVAVALAGLMSYEARRPTRSCGRAWSRP